MRLNRYAPEVAPGDLEAYAGQAGGANVCLAPGGLKILPYQASDNGGKSYGLPSYGSSRGSSGPAEDPNEGLKKAAAIVGAIWLGGCFLGYNYAWPVYLLMNILYTLLSIPPFSWLFGWLWTPLSYIYGWMYRGAPLLEQGGVLQELRLPSDQVSTYLDSYVQQYGDAALIFATHDGYPQLVSALLFSHELGYRDLVDAADENGNTALIYASVKGYRQCVAALLRSGADPDVANQGGGGRTPLMEAAGTGLKEITTALRLSNATVDIIDDFGNTALHYASYHGHLSVVLELLKSNPRKDLTNSYGHTAASYALANKFKAVVDVLNRAPAGKRVKDSQTDLAHLESLLPHHKDKHVHGGAEQLHKRDTMDFAPKLEKLVSITDGERKSLEEQIGKLKRQFEESELAAQRRIVELLERSAEQQKFVDESEREARSHKLNNTELSLKVQELQSRHRASELRIDEEKQRANRVQEDLKREKDEAERQRSRAEVAERERDSQADASRQHEEQLRRKHEEVKDRVSQFERQSHDFAQARDDLRKREEDVRKQRDRVVDLQHDLSLARSGSASFQPSSALHTLPATPEPTTLATVSSTPVPELGSLGAALESASRAEEAVDAKRAEV